jgi:hypothetical protein
MNALARSRYPNQHRCTVRYSEPSQHRRMSRKALDHRQDFPRIKPNNRSTAETPLNRGMSHYQ